MKKTHEPYNEVYVKGESYWDYNFKIQNVIYEVSVNKKTGKLYINRDEDQNKEERAKRCACCKIILNRAEIKEGEGKCYYCLKGNCDRCAHFTGKD